MALKCVITSFLFTIYDRLEIISEVNDEKIR